MVLVSRHSGADSADRLIRQVYIEMTDQPVTAGADNRPCVHQANYVPHHTATISHKQYICTA